MPGYRIQTGSPTQVMGIVNVTPDSFHDGGRHATTEAAVEHALRLEEQGADILDVGGESTRPGAASIDMQEEMARVLPVIEGIRARSDHPISIDTTKANVARRALEAGANWVNDVSAGLLDPEILQVAAEAGIPYVLMHMRGTPATMQKDTRYDDLFGEIRHYFEDRIEACLAAGIRRDNILLDPGIGFGKHPSHNYILLGRLDEFRGYDLPLLLGPSRKSFLKLVGAEDTNDRLPGTLAAVTLCVMQGVEVVRVHDVHETRQVVDMVLRVHGGGASL
ncbi:dihydropteroate synthase [bacterium]|nr:dihydropteroate synthase [bacterium]